MFLTKFGNCLCDVYTLVFGPEQREHLFFFRGEMGGNLFVDEQPDVGKLLGGVRGAFAREQTVNVLHCTGNNFVVNPGDIENL